MSNNVKVLKGRDGFLFLDNDTNNVIEEITGKYVYKEQHLFRFVTLLLMRKAFLESKGIHYYYFIAPNKECVFSDHLPSDIKVSDNRFVIQLLDELKKLEFNNVVYPIKELIEARKIEKVYPAEDTHWNSYGAYIGFFELMKRITKDFNLPFPLEDNAFTFYKKEVEGDLINKISEIHTFKNISVAFKENNISITNNGITNLGGKIITKNTNINLPKAVIFRDSFFSQLLPFVSRMFSECIIVHQPNIDYKIIEDEKPDLVISEQVERFLVQLPNDISGKSFEEYEKEKKAKKLS